MKTTHVTVQLPESDASFIEEYAREHATNVTEIFTRYARRLKDSAQRQPHPKNLEFTGTVPADVDARDAHRRHIVEKHR